MLRKSDQSVNLCSWRLIIYVAAHGPVLSNRRRRPIWHAAHLWFHFLHLWYTEAAVGVLSHIIRFLCCASCVPARIHTHTYKHTHARTHMHARITHMYTCLYWHPICRSCLRSVPMDRPSFQKKHVLSWRPPFAPLFLIPTWWAAALNMLVCACSNFTTVNSLVLV